MAIPDQTSYGAFLQLNKKPTIHFPLKKIIKKQAVSSKV